MALSACNSIDTDAKGRELVEHGTALFPVACYHDDLSEKPVSWHWHEELEAFVVERGTARVCVGGASHIVRQSEGCFINTGALHGVWPVGGDGCVLQSVVFHPRLVGGSVDSILWQKYLTPLLGDQALPYVHLNASDPWLRAASNAICEAWQFCAGEPEGFEFAVRSRLSDLIFLLAKNCPAAEQRPTEKALRDGARIKQMLQYLHAHESEPLTLASIAASAAISKNECLRCFRSMLSCTPIQYLKQVRIQKAAELLSSTDRKISDIGAACGFQEMSYFAKAFREQTGCTPGGYRGKCRVKA